MTTVSWVRNRKIPVKNFPKLLKEGGIVNSNKRQEMFFIYQINVSQRGIKERLEKKVLRIDS